jgi:hypothetical protein
VPRISSFHGIVVAMYYEEHGRPHFHARYAEHDASIAIGSLEVLQGSLPHKALALVRQWARLHHDELEANWERARGEQPLLSIDPLRSMDDMDVIVHVTRVEVIGDHRLHLSFEDGIEGEIDFSDRDWHGVFEPLRDPGYFGGVRLDRELGTIVWPNGADIAPETLHDRVTRQTARAGQRPFIT